MARITEQLNNPFHLKWVRKHFYHGSTASPQMEVSSRKYLCQCFRHKVMRSITFNRSSPGTVDDQAKPKTSYEADQCPQSSNKSWSNPMPDPKETHTRNNSHVSNELHYIFLFPTKPYLLGPPSSSPPEKPLPQIPTQTRPYKIKYYVTPCTLERRWGAWGSLSRRLCVRGPEDITITALSTY
ncbi:Myotrophin [Fusarium oxysporum f. sp. albedinis]|nr:Myotrophin [Fusarium oxysporum f. sp. albedinis]